MEAAHRNSRQLRLLFCSADTYPPFRPDVTVLFGKEMVKRGHRIDWLLQSGEPCRRSYATTWSGGNAWVGKTDLGTSWINRLRKHFYKMQHSLRMFSLGRTRHYDFIQVKDQFIGALLGLMAAKLTGASFIYWLSYPFPEASLYAARERTARYPLFYRARGVAFKWLLYRVIMPMAAHVFVQSEQMKKDVAAQGIALEKLTAVPMGVSDCLLADATKQEEAGGANGQNAIVYLGTLIRERKIDFLIRVLALVRQQVPDAELYLVGRGEDPADVLVLQSEARRCDVEEAVIITGFLPRAEALIYVEKAGVCVSPYYPTPILNSTSPTKVVEYMALGRAVVANDHPEQKLVIAESGGGICTPYAEKPFAAAIIRLLQNPDEATEMGTKGRRYVLEHRVYSKIAAALEEQYFRIKEHVPAS